MEYKDFLLNDIAILSYGNKFDKNKMTYHSPSVNFVSRTGMNNGVSGMVDIVDNVEPFPAGSITLAFGGSIGSCFLQDKPFYTGQNVGVIRLPDNVPDEAKLYFTTALEKICKIRFVTFADEINKHFKTDLSVVLPVALDGLPDWQYMRKCIAELEQERITELTAYLVDTGLDDYELTEEDKQALVAMSSRGGTLSRTEVMKALLNFGGKNSK